MRYTLLILLIGCGPEALTGIIDTPGVNPVGGGLHPLMPFPSDAYLMDGQVSLPSEHLPVALLPESFERADGWSRVQPIVTLLKGGVDPSTLPPASDPSATLEDDSSVWLINAATGERVPLLVELDQRAASPDRQSLILRPQEPLAPSSTYIAVLTSRLRAADGSELVPTEAFRALRDALPTDSQTVEALRDEYEDVNRVIGDLPVEPSEVIQAWPLTTRSEANVVNQALSIQDAAAAWPLDSVQVRELEARGTDTLVWGTFTAPDFLGEDGATALRDDGTAVQEGERVVEFLITVPNSISDQRPVMLFGHGFFSSIEEPTWNSLNRGLQAWDMSAATVRFIGFNEDDYASTFVAIGESLGNLADVADQQLQSHAHFTLLHRALTEGYLDDVRIPRADGSIGLDGSRAPYMGISNGATQGLVLTATSPTIDRAGLVVGGGGWSHMMQRAVQWNTMSGVLTAMYPDPAEVQVVLSLSQLLLDPVDALNFAPRLLSPYDGRPQPQVSMHVAVGDCQVANLVSEWVARAAEIPLLTPSPRDVWGLETVPSEGEYDAGLIFYDEGYPALPEGNVSPVEDNGAHETIRSLSSYEAQLGTFLEYGHTTQICDGACDPN